MTESTQCYLKLSEAEASTKRENMDNIILLDKLVKIKEGGGVLDTEQCFVSE